MWTVDRLGEIEGEWVGVDDNEYAGTDVSINFKNGIDFDIDIDIEAFHLNVNMSPHMGSIIGKGQIGDEKISFIAEDGQLKGEIKIEGNKMKIQYIGDVINYAGLNVGFATDFVRKK